MARSALIWRPLPALATRPARLPESLQPEQTRQLLARCDLRGAAGLRDYAILLLLARLGLRAGEVVAMRLSDLDWSSEELIARGKGMRCDRLPIRQDVGEACSSSQWLSSATTPSCLRMVILA